MLTRLIEFLKNNYPDTDINQYLDAKYIQLTEKQLKQIAKAIQSGELVSKSASDCPASRFIFHFGLTAILVQKNPSNSAAIYQAELAWETDFLSVHSARDKGKGFYFINFELDNDYQYTLKPTEKSVQGQVVNIEKNRVILDKMMPVLKGYMMAISQ